MEVTTGVLLDHEQQTIKSFVCPYTHNACKAAFDGIRKDEDCRSESTVVLMMCPCRSAELESDFC